MAGGKDEELIRECLGSLRALPFVRGARLTRIKEREEVDARLAVDTPTGVYALPCEIKRSHLSHETGQFLVHFAERHPGLMVLAPAVGRELGDLFERAGVNFVDALGNCSVRLADRYVARIQGRKGADVSRVDRGLRAPAYRALFALLVRPKLLEASTREIAANTGVSPQTANDLRRWLVEQAFVLEAGGRKRWGPGRRKLAIELWLAGFTTVTLPNIAMGRFRSSESDLIHFEQRIEPLLDAACSWRYGGGAAAQRLTGHYRGDRTVLYVNDAPADLWRRLRLVRDASGPVVLNRAPNLPAFESPHPRCVHPLLAYADLVSEGHDRAIEAAGELHSRFLLDLESDT
jgi:hypothetical protein